MNTQKPSNPFSQNTKKVNNSTKTAPSVNSSSGIGKIIFFVVIILFIAFLIYIIYVAIKSSQEKAKNSPVIVNDVIDSFVARPAFKLPQVTEGMSHTFSTWIYVKDWNYKFGQYKNILWKGNPPTTANSSTLNTSNIHCPSIWLYPLTNSLKVVTSTSSPELVESCDIQNIPLMKWVHIVYVLNNRSVDVYINGKLERSCALQGIPIITNDPVFITSGAPLAGFYGKISRTQYFTKALLPNEVNNIYQKGALGNTEYQIQFFSDSKLINFQQKKSFSDSNTEEKKSTNL